MSGNPNATFTVWATAWNHAGEQRSATPVKVGNEKAGTIYAIYRQPLRWDTSSLVGKTILSAYITGIVVAGYNFIIPDNLVVVDGTGISEVKEDYGVLKAFTTSYGSITSAYFEGLGAGGTYQIDLNATGIAAINKTGNTDFGLRCQTDIDGTTPALTNSGPVFIMDRYVAGVTDGPTLVVTYSESPPFNRIVTGIRHIYNRKRDDLEITFGGYSTKEELIAPEIMKIADDVTIPQVTEPKKVVPKINTEDIYK
jgi:hypothetical protein